MIQAEQGGRQRCQCRHWHHHGIQPAVEEDANMEATCTAWIDIVCGTGGTAGGSSTGTGGNPVKVTVSPMLMLYSRSSHRVYLHGSV